MASVGVANKINELALVEGNLPSSSVMVPRRRAPGSVSVVLFTQNKIQITFLRSTSACGTPPIHHVGLAAIISSL